MFGRRDKNLEIPGVFFNFEGTMPTEIAIQFIRRRRVNRIYRTTFHFKVGKVSLHDRTESPAKESMKAVFDDGSHVASEYQDIQQTIRIVCISEHSPRTAVSGAVAHDHGYAFFNSSITEGYTKTRLRFAGSLETSYTISNRTPFFLGLAGSQLHGTSINTDSGHLQEGFAIHRKNVHFLDAALIVSLEGTIKITGTNAYFTSEDVDSTGGYND